ncbi:transposase [Nonomuraea sp. NPDC003707]
MIVSWDRAATTTRALLRHADLGATAIECENALRTASSEGTNRLIKTTARDAYGFHNPENQRLRTRCATTRRGRHRCRQHRPSGPTALHAQLGRLWPAAHLRAAGASGRKPAPGWLATCGA